MIARPPLGILFPTRARKGSLQHPARFSRLSFRRALSVPYVHEETVRSNSLRRPSAVVIWVFCPPDSRGTLFRTARHAYSRSYVPKASLFPYADNDSDKYEGTQHGTGMSGVQLSNRVDLIPYGAVIDWRTVFTNEIVRPPDSENNTQHT